MKKILIIGNLNSIHTIKWANFFSKTYEISIISSDHPIDNNVINKNIKTYIFKKFSNKILNTIYIFFLILIKKKVPKNQDIVHIHYLGINGLFSFLFNSKIISTAWGSDIKVNKSNVIKKFFLKKILNRSELITTDSFEIKGDIIKNFYISAKTIKVINFGIDTNDFVKKNYNIEIANKYKLSREVLNIVSLRNHEKIYNIETLIKAISIVAKKIKLTCLIFGDGPETKKYIDLTKKLKLQNKIFFCGRYEQKELAKILSVSDLLVSTSLSDGGIAASTAEAMSCEVVPIITNNSDNKKWIDNEINGFLFENNDFNQLANIILNISNYNIEMMGKAARDKIIKYNDYVNEMNKVDLLYKEIIKN